jgi:hypothetical protein
MPTIEWNRKLGSSEDLHSPFIAEPESWPVPRPHSRPLLLPSQAPATQASATAVWLGGSCGPHARPCWWPCIILTPSRARGGTRLEGMSFESAHCG